jgi:hypothetical protein
MPRTVREKRLDSPAARAKLKHSGKPCWRAIDTGLHLGYRKGLNGGRWVLRRYRRPTEPAFSIFSKRNARLARLQHLPRRRQRRPSRSPPRWTRILDAWNMRDDPWPTPSAGRGFISCPYERLRAERCRAQPRPRGHADDGTPLCAFGAILRRRTNSQIRAVIRDGGRLQYRSDRAGIRSWRRGA